MVIEASIGQQDSRVLASEFPAGNGHLHVLRLLAQWAAETVSALEPLTWNQRTPFHYAARNGQLEVCWWLLESRCDAQRPARDEVSPLQLAVWQNHLTTSQWFVQEAGADALQRNRFGCSVAHWLSQAPAERAGQPQGAALIPLARWLKAEGCDFRAEHGHHCLHKAAWSGHAELCRWLREECGMRDDTQDMAAAFHVQSDAGKHDGDDDDDDADHDDAGDDDGDVDGDDDDDDDDHDDVQDDEEDEKDAKEEEQEEEVRGC
eukprot:s520_g12.t1